MKKHATALRDFTHADDTFPKHKTILNMDAGQFADWESAGLVREATAKEVADERGDKPPAAPKKAAAKPKPSPSKVATTVPAAEPVATGDTPPAA